MIDRFLREAMAELDALMPGTPPISPPFPQECVCGRPIDSPLDNDALWINPETRAWQHGPGCSQAQMAKLRERKLEALP